TSSSATRPTRTIRRPAVPSIRAAPSALSSLPNDRSASSRTRATARSIVRIARSVTSRRRRRPTRRRPPPERSKSMSVAIASTSRQQRLDEVREQHGVPGASLAVLRDDEISAAASGLLNLDTGVDSTIESLFQIGSITKVWTTTVVMQLVDERLMELDAPVRRYLPEPHIADEGVAERVTIRHLLTRSSGIDGDNFADTGRGDDALEKYVASCAPLRQVHPLGASMSYCNTGFSLLGRVIEVATGEVWDTAMCAR